MQHSDEDEDDDEGAQEASLEAFITLLNSIVGGVDENENEQLRAMLESGDGVAILDTFLPSLLQGGYGGGYGFRDEEMDIVDDDEPERRMEEFRQHRQNALKDLQTSDLAAYIRRRCGLPFHSENGSSSDEEDEAQTKSKSNYVNNVSIPHKLMMRELHGSRPQGHGHSYTHTDTHISTHLVPNDVQCVVDRFHQHAFCSEFSADGTTLVVATQEQTEDMVCFYDVSSGFKKTRQIAVDDAGWAIVSVAFSPDSRYLAYSSWNDSLSIIKCDDDDDVIEPERISIPFDVLRRQFCAFSLSFTPDGQEVVAGASDGNVYVLDIENRQRVLSIAAHNDDVNAVEWLDDGNIFLSGGDDSLIKIWDRRLLNSYTDVEGHVSSSPSVGVSVGHCGGITHLNSLGDGRHYISQSKDQTIKLWDVRKHENANSPRCRPQRQLWDYRSAYARFGFESAPRQTRQLCVNAFDGSLMTYHGHMVVNTLIRAKISPPALGSRHIASGSADGAVYIYDVLTGEIVRRLEGHSALVRDVTWHPHQPGLVSCSWDGTVLYWCFDSG